MTEAQFELLLAANREQYEELQAIHHALRRLRGISSLDADFVPVIKI